VHTRFYYYINLILLFFLIYLLLNYEDNEIYDVFYQKNEVFQAKVIITGTRTDCENHLILKEKEIEETENLEKELQNQQQQQQVVLKTSKKEATIITELKNKNKDLTNQVEIFKLKAIEILEEKRI